MLDIRGCKVHTLKFELYRLACSPGYDLLIKITGSGAFKAWVFDEHFYSNIMAFTL